MSKKLSKGLISTALGIVVIGGVALAVSNAQAIIDWWRLLQYTPSAEVKALADNDGLLGRGRDLFYVSDPQLQQRAEFNASCARGGEATIVLGCYKLQHIYLYDIADERLNGVKEVTAAHEMLHAAYERMSSGDKQKVDNMLKPVIESMQDEHILELIRLYNTEEPGELYNEMHSILGTEYANLPSDLEGYYKQYFADRSKVVGYAAQYQSAFIESQKKIEQYDAELSDLKTKIDQNNASLQQQQQTLESQSNQLNQLYAQGQAQQYNSLVPEYNDKVRQFNALIEKTRAQVDKYNSIVAERNQQVAAQDDLYQSLNSSYQPATQQ